MNFDTVNQLVAQLGTMKFFPSSPQTPMALIEFMGDLTDDEEKVRWLVKRVRPMYAEWPGEYEVRACFCSRYAPKDGINAHSTIYPEGLPSENSKALQIAAPEFKTLPPGASVTA